MEVIDAYFAIAQSYTFFLSLSCYDSCFTLLPVKRDEIIIYTYGSFNTARQQGLMVQWLEPGVQPGDQKSKLHTLGTPLFPADLQDNWMLELSTSGKLPATRERHFYIKLLEDPEGSVRTHGTHPLSKPFICVRFLWLSDLIFRNSKR